MPALFVSDTIVATPAVIESADLVWLEMTPHLKNHSIAKKRAYFDQLWMQLHIADWCRKCIRYSRNYHDPSYAQYKLDVIQALVTCKYVDELRGKKGGRHQSRLYATHKARKAFAQSPSTFDPFERPEHNIEIRARRDTHVLWWADGDDPIKIEGVPRKEILEICRHAGLKLDSMATAVAKQDLPLIWDNVPDHVAKSDRVINNINDVCNKRRITITLDDPLGPGGGKTVRYLSPRYRRVYSGQFNHGGRLYDRYGAQKFSSAERETIRFEDEPSVELDYHCLHPTMLYHKQNLIAPDDSYHLWGEATTKHQRDVAKVVLNVALNAPTRKKARGAFYGRAKLTTKTGRLKSGNKLRRAIALKEAISNTNLNFDHTYDMMLDYHHQINRHFGSDAGIRLMWLESEIAIRVMSLFADNDIPCLCIHDSFIVPESCKRTLWSAMMLIYSNFFKQFPVIKDAHGVVSYV